MTTQAELADLINRSPAAVSQATKEGHLCAGYPIAEWAEFTASGRVKGYHVPEAVREALTTPGTGPEETGPKSPDLLDAPTPSKPAPSQQAEPRRGLAFRKRSFGGDGAAGPSPTVPSLCKTATEPEEEYGDSPSSPAEFSREELPQLALLQNGERLKRQEPSTQPQRTAPAEPTDPPVDASKPVDAPKQIDASSRTALLPEGQDYFRPVAAGSAAHALATVAQHDTPAARAITTTCAAATGALLGYYVTDEHPGGALIGASVGFLAVMYGMDPSAFNQ